MGIPVAPLVHALIQLESGLAVLRSPALRRDPTLRTLIQLGVVKSFEIAYRYAVELIAGHLLEMTGRPARADSHEQIIGRGCEIGLVPDEWRAFAALSDSAKHNDLIRQLPAFVRAVQDLLVSLR